MSDYISRQAAIEAIRGCTEYYHNNMPTMIDKASAQTELMMLPSADVRENVRGEWIKKEGSLWTLATCSVCGELSVEGDKPFCPNCGADMRGEA